MTTARGGALRGRVKQARRGRRQWLDGEEQILAQIRRLPETGATVLLVEQNARSALAIADRGYVIEAGRVVLTGTGEELRRDPRVRAAYLGRPALAGDAR
jgi:branched-chain amino acid transport system ATP-binding protein